MDFAWISIVFCIIVNAFRTHACNKFCRLLTSLDTKRIDSKHQEHTDICRNMQESNGNKKRIHQNSDRYFAIYKMQSAATNADLQIRGRRCSRRMAHSDPPPPSRRAGCQRRVEYFCRFLQTPKPQTDPALPADRTTKYRDFSQKQAFRPQISDFWQTFCQSKIPLKSDSSKTHPKPQKSDP